jgi:2-amino-4-hydroxy-6-hydroxymethyldihydropteridine diphosphokinase
LIKENFLIALGGNTKSRWGGPSATLRASLDELRKNNLLVECVSRLYATACFPAGAGPDYVNAAASIRFEGSSHELLALLNQVELTFGRERTERWGQRTLDLDLIAQGDSILPDSATHAYWRNLDLNSQSTQAPQELILPHPRLQDRAFVLVPLMDIAPDWKHPILGLSVSEMLARLPADEIAQVHPI